MTEKQVQIPLRLLDDIDCIIESLLPLLSDQLHPDDVKYIKCVESEIKAKYGRMKRHETFSKYKAAEKGTEEREMFRNKYLDETGIRQSFRSDTEMEI